MDGFTPTGWGCGMSITPTDINIALADLHPDDWQNVLDFMRNLAASSNASTPEEKAYHQQTDLVFWLKQVHGLVDACRLALKGAGNDETDSVSTALLMACNRLYELYEQQELRAKALEAIAYPEDEQGGADHG